MRVCVVGGGAAGMMCAVMIARKGHFVNLFEKNEKLGKKLYITGKGRCNVSNASTGNNFLKNVVHGDKFVMGAITRFNYNDVFDFFTELGVPLKIERGDRIFPESDKSSDIIKAFERALEWAGVKVDLNSTVQEIIVEENKVKGVVVNGKKCYYDAVVIATGGISYPATGSTGDGYKFAKALGHTIIEPVPALCGIQLNEDVKQFNALTLKNVRLFVRKNGRCIFVSEIGEMCFTDNGISGPLTLTCSSYINRENFKDLTMFIDLKPALYDSALEERIDRDIENGKNITVKELFDGLLPQSLIPEFLHRLSLSPDEKANQLSREKRKTIVNLLKNFDFSPKKLENFDSAIITSGGINLKEINPKFMKSKLFPNLYFIGEVLDIDALTGGFNLQLAFSTAVTCAGDF